MSGSGGHGFSIDVCVEVYVGVIAVSSAIIHVVSAFSCPSCLMVWCVQGKKEQRGTCDKQCPPLSTTHAFVELLLLWQLPSLFYSFPITPQTHTHTYVTMPSKHTHSYRYLLLEMPLKGHPRVCVRTRNGGQEKYLGPP
jgi:hypothetical protein